MAAEITVLIADDHPIVRKGLRQLIESDPQLKIVEETGDGQTALDRIEQLQPDVAVLDLDMPGKGGFDIVREMRKSRFATEVIIVTMHGEADLFAEAMDLGVKGYVLKDTAVTDIIAGIKSVAAGRHFISPQLSAFLINRNARAARLETEKPSLTDLTPTEKKILKLIAEGKSSKEIADLMFVNYRTVENHRTNICTRLEIHGSHALLKFALQHKSDL
jgi:DNA-binding NarL/FixJ family response regulator